MSEIKATDQSEGIPIHYFNGFDISFGNADFTITFKLDNRQTCAFKGSYTIVKTLSQKLSDSFSKFEGIVGRPMLTSDEVLKALEDFVSKDKKGQEVKPK
jgi:hypothetical protein